eukprot:jgi/Mesvir1/4246/Mv22214-RA.1
MRSKLIWQGAIAALAITIAYFNQEKLEGGLLEVSKSAKQLLWAAHSASTVPRPVSGEMDSAHPLPFSIWWMAPFLAGGGYCSEAIAFVLALASLADVAPALHISPHGDAFSRVFVQGLSARTKQKLQGMMTDGRNMDASRSVIICHSEPGAWAPPLYKTPPCPPVGYDRALYVVGRTMFETDSVSPHHVQRCNRMDEIWVPTHFHLETFTRAGVNASRLVVVPEPVDIDFYHPDTAEPLRLEEYAEQVFGPPRGEIGMRAGDGEMDDAWANRGPFVFLSVFKWEERKGWDFLLTAFLEEFDARQDDVALYILTNAYHSSDDFAQMMRDLVERKGILLRAERAPPRIYVIRRHIPTLQMPALYKAAHAVVLPSRGEGWGRPQVEAMAMALPVISTWWSGMTEYMTADNSYPLQVEGLDVVTSGPFEGHHWARPSIQHLRTLIRRVYEHPDEARSKGLRARRDMEEKYAPTVLAQSVKRELMRIEKKLRDLGKL